MNKSERKSADNGIWLCSPCSTIIDRNHTLYTPDLLQGWKRVSEEAARLAVEQPHTTAEASTSDQEVMRFFAQCFDRPAFQDSFHRERLPETFDRAIEDTITALNTGALRARDGTVLQRGKGKAYLKSPDLRKQMDVLVELLRAIRARYALARTNREVSVQRGADGNETHYVQSEALADWMDLTRTQVVELFCKAAEGVGVQGPAMPRYPRRH